MWWMAHAVHPRRTATLRKRPHSYVEASMKAKSVTSTDGQKRLSSPWLVCVLLCASALAACNGSSSAPANVVMSTPDATRLLEQATYGPTTQDIAHVQSVGTEAYLNEQFSLPASGYPGFVYYPHTPDVSCQYDPAAPTGPASLCARDNYTLFQVQRMFFTNALTLHLVQHVD